MAESAGMSVKQWARSGRSAVPRLLIPVTEILLIAAIAFVVARLVWLIAFGASAGDFQIETSRGGERGSAARYEADLNRLRDVRIFADRRTRPDIAEVVEQAPETQLSLVLRGVRRGASEDSGAAIIQTPDNRQQFFAVGASIMDGVTLEAVHVDHVIIRRRGIAESLYLREDGQRRAAEATRNSTTANPSVATPDTTGNALQGLDLTDIFQVRPAVHNGRLIGYRLTGQNAPVIEALGFRTGDVITAINDQSLADTSDLAGLFESVEDEDTLFIAVSRNGMALTIQVDLP